MIEMDSASFATLYSTHFIWSYTKFLIMRQHEIAENEYDMEIFHPTMLIIINSIVLN